jgi:hypothetical protein
MTYDKLAELISNMTPEQRAKPAVVPINETGETAEITELTPINDFNGSDDQDQLVLWHN